MSTLSDFRKVANIETFEWELLLTKSSIRLKSILPSVSAFGIVKMIWESFNSLKATAGSVTAKEVVPVTVHPLLSVTVQV